MSVIPPASLEEYSINIAAKLWFFLNLSMMGDVVEELKFEVEFIDGDLLFPCVVLEAAGDEGLGEEESAHPEGYGSAVINPVFHKLYPKA